MDTTRETRGAPAYDDDLYGWALQQAAHLRDGRLDRVDRDNVAEEIESLGKSQLHALTSAYRLVAMHLLKFLCQPGKASASWIATVVRERGTIELLLSDNPGMTPKRAERFAKAYPVARRDAAAETGMPLDAFPFDAPFDVDEVEARDYWPDAARALLAAGEDQAVRRTSSP